MISQSSLLESARTWAHLAVSSYLAENFDLALPAAGISWEQICKAALFAKHPTLLVELSNGRFDSLLALLDIEPGPLRTINATESFRRVQKVYRNEIAESPQAPLNELVAIRNGAVHVGDIGAVEEVGRLMEVFVHASNGLLKILDTSSHAYWGQYEDTIESLFVRELDEFEKTVERKLAKARHRFLELMDRVPGGELEMVAAALQARMQARETTADMRRDISCPACDDVFASAFGRSVKDLQSGWAFEDALPDGDGVTIREYERTWFKPLLLVCGVCDLRLENGEMSIAGVPRMILEEEKLAS